MGQIYKDSSQVDFYRLGNIVWTTIWKHTFHQRKLLAATEDTWRPYVAKCTGTNNASF